MMLRMLVSCALWGIAIGAQAQVYKCIDSGGKTTYLQAPCPSGSKSTAIRRTVPPAPSNSASPEEGAENGAKKAKPSGPKTAAQLEQEFRKRRLAQEKLRKEEELKQANAKLREQNCRNARQQVVNLGSGSRQVRIDETGKRIYLDPSQIAQETANARKLVDQWCK